MYVELEGGDWGFSGFGLFEMGNLINELDNDLLGFQWGFGNYI